MATFIPGITDVYPQALDFKVDYQNLERSLMLNDAAYEQGARRLRSMYDSIFSSTLQRDDTTQKRDAYLKQISGALQSIASTDLSQLQNRDAAYKLFDPISSDALMAKDIVFSKTLASEASKAMAARNSSDQSVRTQYWETGMKALQYQAEEFRNATPDAALSMSSPRYVPNLDLRALADKLYKESGISVKQDVISGGYIWTKKNGDVAYPLTQSMVNSMFASDPAITDMLKTQAYVQRKDFVKQNALKYGSEQAAEIAYFDQVINDAGKKNETQAFEDTKELKDLRIQKASWDKVIKDKGIATLEEREKYLALLDKIKLAEQAAMNSQASLGNQQMNPDGDFFSKRNAADNIIAAANYSILSQSLAKYMAMKNAEVTAKVDPMSLAQFRNNLAIALENVRQVNRKDLEGIKHDNRIKEIDQRGKYQKQGTAGINWGSFFGVPGLQQQVPLGPVYPNPPQEEEEEDPDSEPGID